MRVARLFQWTGRPVALALLVITATAMAVDGQKTRKAASR